MATERLTREAFIAKRAEALNCTPATIVERFAVVECDCGKPCCDGWRFDGAPTPPPPEAA